MSRSVSICVDFRPQNADSCGRKSQAGSPHEPIAQRANEPLNSAHWSR